ncbi:MAG: hypothetical protein A2078_03900 [Nitrospirae bacterium GWC2_57_9]|nr:MAG: hypothetical protein A2078_03900 [Nitrospirae bacterium GWC2_57_9]
MNKVKASVIVCTYNRADLLRSSIQSILEQDLPQDAFEVIVVDNNSKDGTADAVRQFNASAVAVKYFFESRQGLSFARNTGIANAAGEIIVFTDDDIEADRSWLSSLVAVFDDRAVSCAGGPIRPIWPGKRPDWLTDDLLRYLTVSEFGSAGETGAFKGPSYPWGANIAFRRDVFETSGLFPVNLGRSGASLLSNEEIMLCRKIERSGKKIAFAGNAVIHHKIPAERLSKSWFYHRAFWQGRSEAITDVEAQFNMYPRLRHHAGDWARISGNRGTGNFSSICYKQVILGYLFQLMTSVENGDIRKLRTLRTFIEAILWESRSEAILRERDELQRQMHQMVNSTSWKITEPLRWISKMLAKYRQ